MPFPVSIEVYFPPVYYNQKPWKIQLQNESEYRNVKSGCMKGRVHPLYATLFPIRTNNLRNFSQDFFFPLSYHCVRIDWHARIIIESIVFFLADLITLPIRLITCIPRCIHNAKQENARQKEHPFLTYLRGHIPDQQLVKPDRVLIDVTVHNGQKPRTGSLTVYFNRLNLTTSPGLLRDNKDVGNNLPPIWDDQDVRV